MIKYLNHDQVTKFLLSATQVVDARGGPSLKITSRPKKIKSISKKARPSQISRLQKELKRHSELCILAFIATVGESIFFLCNTHDICIT